MKIIAFKRSNIPSLHKDFITEWIDASLLPSLDGYESLVESEFLKELEKNPSRHLEHQENLMKLDDQKAELQKMIQAEKTKEQRELEREFNQFRAWKKNGKKL